MPLKTDFQGGLELNFVPQREFESIKDVDPAQQASIIARNAVRFLLMGWTESWREFITPSVIKAIFVKRDHELLKALRFAFQQGFFEIFEQLRQMNLTEVQKEQAQLYLSNCFSLLPYGDLTPYESFKIPQYIDDQWEMVEYQVTPIELTERKGWRRFFIQDKDRVFAYGLEPIFQKKAESHLIFMGTTYPAGQGFLPQLNTDAKGFATVGKSLYRSGRERIQQWLSQQQNSIHVCGVSLGGSLCLLLASDKGNYRLSRVDALNPAGLHDAWSKSRYDYWDELANKPQVVVQKQGNDPVSAFGIWKNDWDVLQVTPPKDKKGPNSFCDHFLNYAGFSQTKFVYVDPQVDNEKRKVRNFWLYSLGRSFIYYCFLLPYTYVIRPIVNLIMQKWLTSSPISKIGIALDLAEMHDPLLTRNPTMDIYNANNAVDINLTYHQVHSYYKTMRSLVKGKDFLPNNELESKHMEGVSKKVLLEKSMNSQNEEMIVPFKVTKAKAAHIQHSLTLIHQIGIENKEKLKSSLEKTYLDYRVGKPM
ncbi:MAG: hypothetical protein HYX60_02385 [Legionella longbeachae]|nr:hypothetical protein [Legionella longbeachae]